MARLDDIITETLRSKFGASQPNISAGTRGGGYNNRAGGGRGTPGYPVPPEMFEKSEHSGMFIGLKVPADIGEQLAIEGGESPDDLHVTLYYGRDGDPAQREKAGKLAESLFAKYGPITATLGGVGRFSASDSSDGKDVVYVSVDSPQLTAFRSALAYAIRQLGIEPDGTHGYTPHITIKYVDSTEQSPFRRIKPVQVSFDEIKVEDGELGEGERPLKSPIPDEYSAVNEAETPKDLPKGIAHLEDLKPEEFLRFLEKYKDLPLQGGLEVSEKVDGSARISFGAENGQLWTQSKNGDRKTSAEQYPDKPMFHALRMAHKALASKPAIAKSIPPGTFFVAEVLYSKIPNSIEYGPNVVMIHGVHQGDKVLSDDASRKVAQGVIKKTGGQLSDGKDPWKFEYKRVIRPEDVMVDVKEEFSSVREIYDELKKLEPNRLKAVGKGPYKAALEKFKAIQVALKKKLVGQLRKQKSVYGPEGGDVEGLVFRDLESGQLIKLVDKEYFTKLNKFLWYYRELLDKGVKVGEKWEFGIMQKFRNAIADEVLGAPVAKTPGFVKMLQKRAADLKMPAKADTPEKRADFVLAKYIQDEGLMPGDYLSKFKASFAGVVKEFQKLRKEWDSKKKQDLSFDVKGDDGKTIKKVRMDDLIKQRTDTSFQEMADFLAGVGQGVETIGALRGDTTKKVALLKLMMGQNRFGKLVAGGKEETEEPAEESLVREAGPPPVPASVRKLPEKGIDKTQAVEILVQNADKLKKKGIHIEPNSLASKALGEGTRGVAFDIGGGKALKVTNDFHEAIAANKLKGLVLKHVFQVFDVWRFGDGGAYGILQEKLEPLEKKESNTLNFDLWDPEIWGKGTEIPPTIYKSGYDWGKVREIVVQNTQNMARELKTPEEQKALLVKANDAWKNLTQRFHIGDMVTELSSKGIKFHDYHAGNIMKRANGEYVVIDIGYSKVAGGTEPPVLERLIREISDLIEAPGSRKDAIKKIDTNRKRGGVAGVVDANAALLKKRGIVVGKMLGHGSYGIAFDIGKNQVLKVTTDDKEARSSNHIKGKATKHVVRISDVFRFPGDKVVAYGIVEEKLKPLSAYDKREFELCTDLLQACRAGEAMLSGDYEKVMAKVRENIKDPDVQKLLDDQMRQFQLPEIMAELKAHNIEFLDYHQENMMMRGNDYVIIDIGQSRSPGVEPPVLETIIRRMVQEFSGHVHATVLGPVPKRDLDEAQPQYPDDRQEYQGVDGNLVNHTEDGSVDKYAKNIEEAVADTVGVTIGRFQPFHRGHAEVIRKLAHTHSKVIVLVAGNTPDKKNPFSYETRLKVMKDSLPDVWRKLEVYKATAGGKNTGFVPGVLADIVGSGKSSVKGDTAVEILVGPDRFDQMQQQLDRAKSYKEAGNETDFDPEMAIVKRLQGVKNDDDTDRISGTRVRQAIMSNDREGLKKMMDPHLVSNPDLFDTDLEKMRQELAKYGPIKEDLHQVGGEEGVVGILNSHAQALHAEKQIDVKNLKKLGQGTMGVVFEIPGGKVLKVTTDKSEAGNAALLKGKNLPHVVRVYDVFGLSDRRHPTVPVACIIREELTPMSPQEISELNDLVDLIRDDSIISITANGDFKKTMEAARTLMTKEIRKDLGLPEQIPQEPTAIQNNKREIKAKGLVDSKMMELEARLKHFQIDQIMHDLKSLGIRYADYKGDNVMKRGGAYVLADFGGGKTNGPQPPVLEKIVETVISEIGITFNTNTPGGTQAGLRAGSSGWSSPQGMYDDEEIRDIQNQKDDEFTMWSDELKGIDTAKAIGEAVIGMISEKNPMKTADRPSNQFEHDVAFAIQSHGITAKAVGGNDPKKADVEVTIGGKSAYVEAKYTEAGGANLVSARMKLVDGKWQGAGEETGFTRGIASDLEKNPDAQKFLKDMHNFVAKYRQSKGLKAPKTLSMPAQGKAEDVMKRNPTLVTPDEVNIFIENRKSSGVGNRYIYLDVRAGDVQKLVAAHYKAKNAPYMQFGNDFYLLGDEDPFGLSKLNPPVPQFQVTAGRKGVRVASRTGRYELIPELKALKVAPSPYSLLDPNKKFPFKKSK